MTNVTTVFMNYMNMIFPHFLDKFVMVFINDILIYLYVKLLKCEFWMENVQFMGNVISTQGITVDLTKVEVML